MDKKSSRTIYILLQLGHYLAKHIAEEKRSIWLLKIGIYQTNPYTSSAADFAPSEITEMEIDDIPSVETENLQATVLPDFYSSSIIKLNAYWNYIDVFTYKCKKLWNSVNTCK